MEWIKSNTCWKNQCSFYFPEKFHIIKQSFRKYLFPEEWMPKDEEKHNEETKSDDFRAE